MLKQQVPDIEFESFVLGEIKDLFEKNKIFINTEYQRGYIWKLSQRIELIRSINNQYSISVIVLFINEKGQFEILDGQQRLKVILDYVNGDLELKDTDITPYENLGRKDKILLDAYSIYYLKLKSHHAKSREEDITQTFLRLQEGTSLNRAEKISAHRGVFKDAFRQARDNHKLFKLMGFDKRFRLRLLAAEMLLLELEGDFDNGIFPSLELQSFVAAIGRYKKISAKKLRFFEGNLDLLHASLNYLLTAMKPSEVLPFYLLISYLRRYRAGNQNLINEISSFAKEFLRNLHSFGIYDQQSPEGMEVSIFNKYKAYKLAAKVMTTPESIKERFKFILEEFDQLIPILYKDPTRFHSEEQKRKLYFRQKGICPVCNKQMNYKDTTSDHIIRHSEGGKTDDLKQAQLLHLRCHAKVEKARNKSPN